MEVGILLGLEVVVRAGNGKTRLLVASCIGLALGLVSMSG